MELRGGVKILHAKTRKQWRNWLERNCGKEKSVWLIIYKKGNGIPSVYYPEAVDEALCYGWMDSKIIPASNYWVYSSSGEMPKALINTWMMIWNSGMERAYIADFDIYGQEPSVKTYISV